MASTTNTAAESSAKRSNLPRFNYMQNSSNPPYTRVIKVYGNHESLNLQYSEPEIARDHKRQIRSNQKLLNFLYLVGFFLIGVVVAGIGSIIMTLTHLIVKFRLKLIHYLLKNEGKIYPQHTAFGVWIAITFSFALTSSVFVTYVEPKAVGGGTAFVKLFLNGLSVHEYFSIRTLCTKVVALICALSADFPGGFEGPMIFIGGVVGGRVCELFYYMGRSDSKATAYFKDANALKDFVLAGVVAGVGSGFKAPIGGVLLALEEAASFWDYKWIVISLIAASMSTFCTQLIMATLEHKQISLIGEFNVKEIGEMTYSYYEIPLFMGMGVIGGIIGSLWTIINVRISRVRAKFLITRWLRIIEVCAFSLLLSTIGYMLFHAVNDCEYGTPLSEDEGMLTCPDGSPSSIKYLIIESPAEGLRFLLSRHKGDPILPINLAIFLVFYFFASSYAWGLSVCMGNFLPQLFLGAIWGRLGGNLLSSAFPDWEVLTIEKYTILGAASQLVGVTRTPVSSSVIMLEITSMSPTFIAPLICAVLCAKFVADHLTEGLFEREVHKYPILPWQPFPCALKRTAAEIMSAPIICFFVREKVSYIYQILKTTPHVGFPVVRDTQEEFRSNGILIGMILREVLIFVLKNKCFEETRDTWISTVSKKYISRPRRHILMKHVIEPTTAEMDYTVDLTLFMTKSIFRVPQDAYVPALFGKIRGLGLTHLVVVDEYNRTVGMITRKDLLCE